MYKVSQHFYTTNVQEQPMFSKNDIVLNMHWFMLQKVGHSVEGLAQIIPEI